MHRRYPLPTSCEASQATTQTISCCFLHPQSRVSPEVFRFLVFSGPSEGPRAAKPPKPLSLKRNPVDRTEIVAGPFSGSHPSLGQGGDWCMGHDARSVTAVYLLHGEFTGIGRSGANRQCAQDSFPRAPSCGCAKKQPLLPPSRLLCALCCCSGL